MKSDVARFIRACSNCQRNKKGSVPKAAMGRLPSPKEPFELVSMDTIGDFPRTARGNRYILVLVDHATRFPAAKAVPKKSAAQVRQFLLETCAIFGFPRALLTDQGQEYVGSELMELYKVMGIVKLQTTAYHPQTNGLCERFNGYLQSLIATDDGGFSKDWDLVLPWALLTARETVNRSTGFAPAQLMYNRNVRGPLAILNEEIA